MWGTLSDAPQPQIASTDVGKMQSACDSTGHVQVISESCQQGSDFAESDIVAGIAMALSRL
jgi:hypothetical protein